MLLTEKSFKNTMAAGMKDVTETALDINPEGLEKYVRDNAASEYCPMTIRSVYDSQDGRYRHVLFDTPVTDTHFIAVLQLPDGSVTGHFILDLNKEYGLDRD